MISEAIFILFFAVILGVGICAGIMLSEAFRRRRIEDLMNDVGSWCWDNCLRHEQCFKESSDVDDSLKELQDYCDNCPMMYAMERMKK